MEGNAFPPEMWTQFMNVQNPNPAMQNMMTQYIEQSKNLFVQMQDQMQKQASTMFGGFGYPPGSKTNGRVAEPTKK
jgi:polyhydroxyalkanoate synthesis regulator protein